MTEKADSRFDKLLKAMLKGEAPKGQKPKHDSKTNGERGTKSRGRASGR